MIVANSIEDLKSTPIPSDNYAKVLGFYNPGDGGGGDFYWDNTDTSSADNDGTILKSSVNGANGRWKREIISEFNAKWFGVKGNGLIDDTTAIAKAMEALINDGYGVLYFPAGTYLINNLQVHPGISLIGKGGDSYVAGFTDPVDNVIKPSPLSARFKVPSNGTGLLCENSSDNFSGGRLENIAIIADEGALWGLKIAGVGWSTNNVSIWNFNSGCGLIIGKSWRSMHNRLQIRRCGVGMYWDGSIDVINGVTFINALIEQVLVGVIQVGASNGGINVGNSFNGLVIEDVGHRVNANLDYNIPNWVTILNSTLEELGVSRQDLSGGIILQSNCHLDIFSIYTEAMDGPQVYCGNLCSININGGLMSQTNIVNTIDFRNLTHMVASLNNRISLENLVIKYNADSSIYKKEVFRFNKNYFNSFKGLSFSKYNEGDRLIYKDYSATNIYNHSLRWQRGFFTDSSQNLFGLQTKEFVRSTYFANITTSEIVNESKMVDLLDKGYHVINTNLSTAGAPITITLNYSNINRCIEGMEMEVCFITSGNTGSLTIKLNTPNIQGDISNLPIISSSQKVFLRLRFLNSAWWVNNIFY